MSDSFKTKQGRENREWGIEAEEIAANYLRGKGYIIRERNWRAGKTIEIDIIAEKNGVIAFVEVKARKGDFQSAYDAVDDKKMGKIIKGGDIYLRMQPHLFRYRLDIITVTGSSDNYTIDHLEDAFLPPLTLR